MAILILSVILALAIGGCACVVWAARGTAPRWARVWAAGTRGAGELLSILMKSNKGSRSGSSSDGSD
ncbi:hypothetical protein AB0I00_32375 [Streptomyces sp. NPDC050803]|uniref:hypothetical protein n=1 Tax=unclassified Streptomyces TaxID=2593676 RepID=UPI00341267A3